MKIDFTRRFFLGPGFLVFMFMFSCSCSYDGGLVTELIAFAVLSHAAYLASDAHWGGKRLPKGDTWSSTLQHLHPQLWGQGMLSSWRTSSSLCSPVDIEIGVGESRNEFETVAVLVEAL